MQVPMSKKELTTWNYSRKRCRKTQIQKRRIASINKTLYNRYC